MTNQIRLQIGLLLLIAFSAVLFIIPATSYAYFTTDQAQVRLTDTTALYTITYKFGSEKDDFYMPIGAVRDLPHGSQTKSVGYEIREDKTDVATGGKAAGIVLSNAKIVDGMYKAPKGFATTFTLVVIYTAPAGTAAMPYSLQMIDLPFYVGDDREARQMNPSELQYYTTSAIDLKNI